MNQHFVEGDNQVTHFVVSYMAEISIWPHLSEHSCKSGIVCSGSDETEGKDRVMSDFSVRIVRKLAQRVKNVQLWVRDRNETESEGNGATNGRLAVAKKVSEVTEGHFRPNVFTHCNEGQTKHGDGLLGRKIWNRNNCNIKETSNGIWTYYLWVQAVYCIGK